MNIRTRIAPSPTGLMHIGTARTALFNYLFARANGGSFMLRFEDTDKKRSLKKFERDILDSLKWLKIQYDEGPMYQSKRLKIYKKYLKKLEERKAVYKKDGAAFFKIADYGSGNTVGWKDLIRDDIRFALKDLKDFVIMKSDGMPGFMFSNMIDDLDLGITDVIRGEDLISSTPSQILIANALNIPIPRYGHLPLILAPDRSKLSKRHGAISVKEYERMGIVPDAVVNYLALLGWNPGSNQEFFSLGDLEHNFTIERVHKSGAIFDMDKLMHLNRLWLKTKSDTELLGLIKPHSKLKAPPQLLKRAISVVRGRLSRLVEFDSFAQFIEAVTYHPTLLVFKQSSREATRTGLETTLKRIGESGVLFDSPQPLRQLLTQVVAQAKLNNGDVFWPVRVALSGQESSPPPHELMYVLGRDESIKRISKAIEMLENF
ncbi:glutamate--tRNA ligase [Candidatus Berkelbacteria bacterium]|nr:glutamate--tRNA ligase [Candidatus Berkelbacteria bacterium]